MVYGRTAPIKRNEEMIKLCDMAFIFWDGVSRGAKSTLDYTIKCNK